MAGRKRCVSGALRPPTDFRPCRHVARLKGAYARLRGLWSEAECGNRRATRHAAPGFRHSPSKTGVTPLWLHPGYDLPRETAMKARVTVTLKTGVLDPQGKAIEGALKSLGVSGVASVRQGRVFDIELDGADRGRAEAALKDAAEKLLANTIIENYRVEVVE